MTRSGRSKSLTEGPSASAARSGTISRSIPGVDTDFIDLVFNIGAPRDAYLGGGTYGFGKTISYVASSVGTILIWSRCEGSSGLEHRLIGSAIGDGFNMDGLRFTGRHWWGNAIASEGRVEPAVGDLAEELGEAVFATRFDRDVTGTSILILDPQLGGDSPEKSVELLAEAVVWNLWPKLLAEQSGRSRMNITVQLNGTPIALPSIEQHPVLSGHAQCLLAVRAAQAGSDPAALPLRYPVNVEEIWLRRPLKLLGHLALTRYPVPSRTGSPSHAITFMRHKPNWWCGTSSVKSSMSRDSNGRAFSSLSPTSTTHSRSLSRRPTTTGFRKRFKTRAAGRR